MKDYMLTFELNKEDESQELAIHGSSDGLVRWTQSVGQPDGVSKL